MASTTADGKQKGAIDSLCVVIPTKDGADTLPALLDALDAQRCALPVDVFAVDSGSRDGSVGLMRERGVRVEEIAPESFDHGGTRNRAIAGAKGDVAVLLTQDAVPAGPGFLDAIVRPFADPAVAGVYGRQIPREDCDVVTRRQLEGWLTGRDEPATARLEGAALDDLAPGERHQLCVFDNVCSAVRRSVWEALPFPTTAFGEDIGWGRAAIEAGHTIAYAPDAAVVHSHRRSVFYEYERTRVCHARLNELFGLATLPRARDVVARATAANLRSDLPYVWHHAPGGVERARQLARIAALSLLSPLAQHLGIRDAKRARRDARSTR